MESIYSPPSGSSELVCLHRMQQAVDGVTFPQDVTFLCDFMFLSLPVQNA